MGVSDRHCTISWDEAHDAIDAYFQLFGYVRDVTIRSEPSFVIAALICSTTGSYGDYFKNALYYSGE